MLTHPSSDHEASGRSVEVSKRRPGRWDSDYHPVLATPTARLRELRPDDRPCLVEIFDHHGHTEGTIDAPRHFAADSARRWIAARIAEEQMGYALHWAVCLLSEDRLFGYVGLQDIDFQHSQAELRFWLESLPDSESLQVDVAQAALAFAFATLELNSVRAIITPGKLQTAAVLTALGMHQLQPISKAGSVWTRFDDVHIWTITKHHWTGRLRW